MLDRFGESTSLCSGCPKMCRHACPVSNAELRETVTPGLKMTSLDLVRLGALPLDEAAAAQMHACTGCGACSEYCLLGNDVASVLVGAREEAARAGVSPVATEIRANLARSGNPTGDDLVALQTERCPPRPTRGELTYFPGCTALRRLPEHASDAVAALETGLGKEVAIAPVSEHAACCGYPLWAAGLIEEFKINARRLVTHLSERGTLVTTDPGCMFTMTRLYAEAGVPALPVKHISQVLSTTNVPEAAEKERSLYHDPCYLGRHLGVFDAPREVLQKATGSAPEEFVWNREKSECCGGGALYPMANPEGARTAAVRRVRHESDELARTGATRVVTSCPTCEVQLGRAGVRVFDLSRAVLGKGSQAPRDED